MKVLKEFPRPVFVADDPHSNNTDETVDPQAEKEFIRGNYYLSTAQGPLMKTSVFQDEKSFARAMLSQEDPTLLAIGGQYANMRNVRVEDVLPFLFPFGIGGPGGKRRTRISQETCFQRYFRLSNNQFMTGDACTGTHVQQITIVQIRSDDMQVPTGWRFTRRGVIQIFRGFVQGECTTK